MSYRSFALIRPVETKSPDIGSQACFLTLFRRSESPGLKTLSQDKSNINGSFPQKIIIATSYNTATTLPPPISPFPNINNVCHMDDKHPAHKVMDRHKRTGLVPLPF